MDDYSASYQDKRAAQTRHAQAVDQLNLLQRGRSALSSDFYTYRYLATEGFLPGYNFPRLPLLAYVPASRDGRGKQAYLQRPRFLGTGRIWAAQPRLSRGTRPPRRAGAAFGGSPGVSLARKRNSPPRPCASAAHCGAGHFPRRRIDVPRLRRLVGRRRGGRQHLSDRKRRHLSRRAHHSQRRRAAAPRLRSCKPPSSGRSATRKSMCGWRLPSDADDKIAHLAYGPGATITRLNKGLRRRANKTDSRLPHRSDFRDTGPRTRRRIRRSASSIRPLRLGSGSFQASKIARTHCCFGQLTTTLSEVTLTTCAARAPAWHRGGVPTRGRRDARGAHAYPRRAQRLPALRSHRRWRRGAHPAREPGATSLPEVARTALEIMHLAVGDDEAACPKCTSDLADQPEASCVAACYRCLMSYYNQPDHELLDRRDAERTRPAPATGARRHRAAQEDRQSPVRQPSYGRRLARRAVADRGIPAWDSLHLTQTASCTVSDQSVCRIWRKHYVAALVEEADLLGLAAAGGPRLRSHSIRGCRRTGIPAFRKTRYGLGTRTMSELAYAPGSLVSARGQRMGRPWRQFCRNASGASGHGVG